MQVDLEFRFHSCLAVCNMVEVLHRIISQIMANVSQNLDSCTEKRKKPPFTLVAMADIML